MAVNGVATGVNEMNGDPGDLFARRVIRLEEVSRQLRAAYRELAQCQAAERQQKADIYLHSTAPSHGERQGISSAHTASLSIEVLQLKGEIDALEEERNNLMFLIEWVGEG